MRHNEVLGDRVNEVCLAYNDAIEKSNEGFDLPWCDEDAMRAALQADRQRVGGVKVLPSELQGAIDYLTVVTCSSHLPGWKKNREMWEIVWNALFTQHGQAREGSHDCPTCGGPCDMFEEEGSFEIAYIYRSTAK